MSIVSRCALVICAVLLSLCVAGCGGGGNESGAENPSAELPMSTLAQYGQMAEADGQGPQVRPLNGPDASALAVGAAWTQAELLFSEDTNVAAVLPIGQSYVASVRRASRGDTLAQLDAAADGDMRAFMSLALSPVMRSVWAQSRHLFRLDFLKDTRLASGTNPAGEWQATEIDFSLGMGDTHPQFLSSRQDLMMDWPEPSISTRARFVVMDRLALSLPLPSVAPSPAVFTGEDGRVEQVEAIVLREGVRMFDLVGFRAGVVRLSDYTLMQLTPTSDNLAEISPARLRVAVQDAWSRSTAGEAGQAGYLVMPNRTFTLQSDPHRLLAGVHLPFDPVRADLRGLDEHGGAYIHPLGGSTEWTASSSALTLTASAGVAYIYQPDNLHQAPGGGDTGWGIVDSGLQFPCPEDAADWKSGYLVLLDQAGEPVAIVALRNPEGARCLLRN